MDLSGLNRDEFFLILGLIEKERETYTLLLRELKKPGYSSDSEFMAWIKQNAEKKVAMYTNLHSNLLACQRTRSTS
jgi:hypothetical protein